MSGIRSLNSHLMKQRIAPHMLSILLGLLHVSRPGYETNRATEVSVMSSRRGHWKLLAGDIAPLGSIFRSDQRNESESLPP